MLALYGVVRLFNSCHLNMAHNNVECSTQAYNGTFAFRLVCYPPNTATIPHMVRKSR